MGSEAESASRLFEELHPPLSGERAVFEASRCLECGGPIAKAPCVVACPTHIDIPKFIREIRRGDPQASAETIFESNILGGSCARVCPLPELCEGACVLNKEGRRPITIGLLQRYATDYALKEAPQRLIEALKPDEHHRFEQSVGVIGAGPAGLSCAAELARRGCPVTVYESRSDFGGLVTYAIAPYKQLKEPIPQEAELVRQLGVEFQLGVAVGRDIALEELEAKHEAIFLGIGMGEDLSANLPGEDLEGVWRSLEFIEKLKLGRLDEIDLGERVVVIGGGNTAIDVAREAVRLGAKDVRILYRRTREQMPAYKHEVEEAEEEGVRFWWLTAPEEFLGDGGRLKAVRCIYMKLGAPDRSGRPRPQRVPGTEFTIEVDSVILAIGQQARRSFIEEIEGLQFDDRSGLVKVNEYFQTTNPKYFAGGDCVNGGGTVVEAVQHGRLAAKGIEEFLKEQAAQRAERRA
jgi:glutamate synthase (NADPH/NADH) small chain